MCKAFHQHAPSIIVTILEAREERGAAAIFWLRNRGAVRLADLPWVMPGSVLTEHSCPAPLTTACPGTTTISEPLN